jgi:hypothetical protein
MMSFPGLLIQVDHQQSHGKNNTVAAIRQGCCEINFSVTTEAFLMKVPSMRKFWLVSRSRQHN